MELEKLSSKELADLERQIAERKKQEAQARQEKKQQYADLVEQFVEDNFVILAQTDVSMDICSQRLHDDARAIIDLKKDAFNIENDVLEKQQSHTFTDSKNRSIIVGYNIVDGWDDTLVNISVTKVKDWIASKLNKENESLIEMIRFLLKPNKDGLLKASRVLELLSCAQNIGDPALIDAVKELQEAYKPKKTTTFIKAKFRDDKGLDVWLNLSMTR